MARLTVTETQLEGELRYVHNRIIGNCEEIAFYQGNQRCANFMIEQAFLVEWSFLN